MYQRSQAAIAVVLVALSIIILFFSLRAPNIGFLNGAETRVEQQSMVKLLQNEWIPGHPLYPLLMIRDRIALWTTPDLAQKILLYAELGKRRRQAADTLLARHEEGLALTTLSKSQAYLIQAASTVQEIRDETQRRRVIRVVLHEIDQFSGDVERWKLSMSDQYNSKLDDLMSGILVANTQLQSEN